MAIGELRGQGRDIGAELLSFIEGWRPLRPTTVTQAGTTFMLHP
ncbi:hypothetical protein [Actinomadura darangshiensis]|nr:hypothetical protein [Actinomadura darangshiensis]